MARLLLYAHIPIARILDQHYSKQMDWEFRRNRSAKENSNFNIDAKKEKQQVSNTRTYKEKINKLAFSFGINRTKKRCDINW